MNKFSQAYYIARHLGIPFISNRVKNSIESALGLTRRRFNPRPWNQIELCDILLPGIPTELQEFKSHKQRHLPRFLFPFGCPPTIKQHADSINNQRNPDLAQRIALLHEGRCLYFFDKISPDTIDWHKNAFEQTQTDPDKTWCDLADFSTEQGDARTMWEPARAAWAIDIARGRARGLPDATPELFWHWVDHWMIANPPYRGFHWKSGQESAVRFIAIAIACWTFGDDAMNTPERWQQLVRFAWANGVRIAGHVGYAVSQKNNHALSEACSLMLIGQLFPELKEARRWQAMGRQVICQQLPLQIYNDGSYIQHSTNYHRVMLDVATLSLRLAELCDDPFSTSTYELVGKAARWLHQMTDENCGGVPNYGHNDGALVLPLSECDFTDYRPAVQSANYLSTRSMLLPDGPWNEALSWLFGDEALSAKHVSVEHVSTAFDDGGYYTLRTKDSWAMIRCHTYRDRPSHCDPLHVDIWWRGLNVIRDCGTYRYYDALRPDVERYFKSVSAHNTVLLEDHEPMELVSRFLWLPWIKAKKNQYEPPSSIQVFEGEHYGYRRSTGVTHRRTVAALGESAWIIVDDLLGNGLHNASLYWHTIDAPFTFDDETNSTCLHTDQGSLAIAIASEPHANLILSVVRGCDTIGSVQGFASKYYGTRQPIPTIIAKVSGVLPIRFVTFITDGNVAKVSRVSTDANQQKWKLSTERRDWFMSLSVPHQSTSQTVRSISSAPNGDITA